MNFIYSILKLYLEYNGKDTKSKFKIYYKLT